MKHILVLFIAVLFICTATVNGQQSSVTSVEQPSPAQSNESAGFIQFPRQISYQGLLTTSSGAPAPDGNYDLQFDLFNVPVVGASLWSETQSGVVVTNGTFTVRLGSVTVLPDLFHQINYLEITALAGPGISGSVTFSPRIQLTASPYSLGPWQSNGYDVFVPYARVGIGTSTPTERLQIENGDLKLSNGSVFVYNGSVSYNPGPAPLIFGGHDNSIDKRMWIAHSEAFPDYGIQYRDLTSDGLAGDALEFVGGDITQPTMSFQVNPGIMRMYNSSGTGTFILNSSTGRAGIGTLTPATDLEVSGAGTQTLRATSTDNGEVNIQLKRSSASVVDFSLRTYSSFLEIGFSDDIDNIGPTGLMYFGDNYNVTNRNFVPNINNTFDLGHAGLRWRDVYTVNLVNSSSDIRLKSNVNDLSYGLKEILSLRPVSYNWKSNPEEGTKLGLIAQEVRPIISEIVKEGDDAEKTLALSYTELIPVLIKAIQEQQTLIENLNNEVASVQSENVELRKVKNQYEALSMKIQHIEQQIMRRVDRTTPVTAVGNK